MYEAPLGAPNTLSETTHPHQNIPPYIQDVFCLLVFYSAVIEPNPYPG